MVFTGKFNVQVKAVFMACLLFATPSLMALGLGEITLNSSLNEPLDADIKVLSSADLDEGQLLVSLASAESFERAGISRGFFLNQMQFSIYRDSSDLHIIKIVTKQPVVEPYLDFLVQLQWPAGRVMREYTLLLDLPIYSDAGDQAKQVGLASQAAPAQQASPAVQSGSSGFGQAVEQTVGQIVGQIVGQSAEPPRKPLSGDEHRVIVGDTLWNVAKRLRPRNTTILQTMDSLYRQNSDAFVEGDANRLKAGSILRLPSFDEISLEAGNTVAAQIGLKNPSIASAELESALEQANQPSDNDNYAFDEDQPLLDDGRLELASAFDSGQLDSQQLDDQQPEADGAIDDQSSVTDASSQSGSGETNQINQLAEELAVASDEANKVQQENIELRERLALLEAQVATMAALLSQSEKPSSTTVGMVEAASAADNTQQGNPDNQSLTQQLSAVPSYFWLLLIAIILFLLVLLVRKSSKDQESKALGDNLSMDGGYEAYDDKAHAPSASNNNQLHALDDLELNPDDDLFDESDTDIFENQDQPVNPEVFDMMVEAVAEADVYLSLGKTAEAIEVLEEAREQDPADASSRLKLMEVLFRENRKDELRPLFDEIKATGDESEIEMAAIIVGPDTHPDAVVSISDESVASELEGLDFQSSDFEDLGLGSVDLTELDLDDIDIEGVEFEGDELEDLDLDNLTADDFDIEPAEQPEPVIGEPEPLIEEPELEQEQPEPVIETPEPVQEQEDQKFEPLSDQLVDEFSGFDGADDQSAVDVKLDLAKTYLEMGDPEGAKEILEELIEDSDEDGKAKAKALLETV